jgi:hypothetical protein
LMGAWTGAAITTGGGGLTTGGITCCYIDTC